MTELSTVTHKYASCVSKHSQLNASMCVPSGMTPHSKGRLPSGRPPLHSSPSPPALQTASTPIPKQPLVHILPERAVHIPTLFSRQGHLFCPFHSKSSTSWWSLYGAYRDFGCISCIEGLLFSTNGLEFLLFQTHLSRQAKYKGCSGNICVNMTE